MSEKDKENENKTEVNGKVSVLENMRRINEEGKREELKAQAEKGRLAAERERAEREKYEQRLERERIELMKLKQGIISEEDIPKETEEKREYTAAEKIGNFFYHYKFVVLASAVIAAILGFLVYDIVTAKDPDVSVMIMATDSEFEFRTQDIETMLESYCEDYNGDGEIYVRVSYLPAVVDENNAYYMQSYQTKLMAEFQDGVSIIVIADADSCKTVGIESVSENGNPAEPILADMRNIYPGDDNCTKLGYMLSGTNFAEDIKYTEMSDSLFIGFRVPRAALNTNIEKFTENYNNALELWDNYLNGKKIEHGGDVILHSQKNN